MLFIILHIFWLLWNIEHRIIYNAIDIKNVENIIKNIVVSICLPYPKSNNKNCNDINNPL